ncbi:MAG: hypothetical protein ACOYIG_01455 [Acetivibrionales bacterium]|jgi:hypothetical protein|nr:hypothetical protein [Clostridiaceae bacterium]
MNKAMFERYILYPTQNPLEPGSAHVTVYPPENSGGLPIVIKAKTNHNPVDYVIEIISILQTDVFDRIRIDIRSKGIIYFVPFEKNISPVRVKFTEKDNYTIEEVLDADILK